jgi:hypothetical protein
MSWDLPFCASNEPPPPVAEMPGDWKGQPLGSLKDVRAKISSALPNVNWSDPSWGIFEGVGYSYEFNIGKSDPCDSFVVHVRGTGDAVGSLVCPFRPCLRRCFYAVVSMPQEAVAAAPNETDKAALKNAAKPKISVPGAIREELRCFATDRTRINAGKSDPSQCKGEPRSLELHLEARIQSPTARNSAGSPIRV